MSLHRITAASSAAVCSIVLVSSTLAHGQEKVSRPVDAPVPNTEFDEQKQNLRERNRSSMHPGDALVIVGVEQGDNDIRSRTPALVNSDRNSTKVNDDEAYQRRLALYEDGGHKLQPLTIARPMAEETTAAPKSHESESESLPTHKGRFLSLCIGFLASALFCVWAFKRYANLFSRPGA